MPIRWFLGGLLLLAGAALLVSALWQETTLWKIDRVTLPIPDDLAGRYPPTAFERWQAREKNSGKQLTFHVFHFQDERGKKRQTLMPDPGSHAWQEWMELAGFLRQQTENDALIITWWDNAQRIDFLTGRSTWARQPPAAAFRASERSLWQQLSGGFSENSDKLVQLASWLSGDSERALDEIGGIPSEVPIYLLVTSNDLIHVDEIERLSGRKLPLEVRIFPSTGNLHGQISAVQAWAQETGGVYLPQSIPEGIATWRITGPADPPLLLRLLPFTHPHRQLPATIRLAYQSPGGKLILYHINHAENTDPL